MTVLTLDGLLAVADVLGVQTFPVVLTVVPKHDHIDTRDRARRAALDQLAADRVIDQYGDVDEELAVAVRTLARPDRELVARIYAPDGLRRVCLARRGLAHVVAERTGDDFDVRTVWGEEDPAVLVRPLLAALGFREPIELAPFTVPSDTMCARLDAARTSSEFADLAYHFGLAERDSVEFGMAMANCHTHAEIAAYRHDDGVTRRSAAGVAVYDTDRGRLVAGPGRTVEGQRWSTFAPGTDHRLAQAISALIASLPGERWMS
ncbi:ESX secretion-associated protein EspG [Nocardia sp. NPDC052566]|uniref:ESX secretion-associated protein EspG n=1 Tax=Nocardia sp. NPDC052566 TaxID=3364330 RepID=UPI0037C6BBD5